jgi:hypothetical protein
MQVTIPMVMYYHAHSVLCEDCYTQMVPAEEGQDPDVMKELSDNDEDKSV